MLPIFLSVVNVELEVTVSCDWYVRRMLSMPMRKKMMKKKKKR